MSENRTGIIVWGCNAFLYLFTFLLVSTAIALTVIRYHPSISHIVEQKIESKLADIINADINIESFDLDRRQLSPQILAENVLITDRDNPQNAWSIKKVLLGVDVIRSLLSGSVRVTELIVEGIDFEVHKDKEGNININQTFLIPVGTMTNERSGQDLSKVQIQLTDSNLVWRDELLNVEYVFNDINMLINATSNGHKLSLIGQLPVEMGDTVELHAQVDGDLRHIHAANTSFHVKVTGVVTEEISGYFVEEDKAILPIVADVEVWGDTQGLSLQSLRGDVFLNHIVTEASNKSDKSCLTNSYIKSLAGQFRWENSKQGWSLNARDLYVETSTGDWPSTYLHISEESATNNATSYFANIGFIKVDDVCNTLQAYAEYGFDVDRHLQKYQLNGQVADLLVHAELIDKKLSALQYAGNVEHLDLRIRESGQLVKGISGYAQGSLNGGRISLDTQRLTVGLPDIYKESPLEFGVKGDLHWLREDKQLTLKSNPLHVYNNDLALDLRWDALLDGDQIYVDSQIIIPQTRAEIIWKYFPNIKKTIRTKNWLRHALHQGDVKDARIMVRGNMRKFPFQDHAGVFETSLEISNGTLEYKRDWPKLQDVRAKLLINDAHLSVRSDHARMFNTRVKNVDIQIESFLLAVMYGKGVAEGSAKDLLSFLDESKLVGGENSILNTITLEGDSRLELDFSTSLSLTVNHPVQVAGDVHFLGNSLNIEPVSLQLRDIGGKFSFDKSGATADAVNATLYDKAIKLSASPIGEGVTNISFSGPFNLGKYINQRYPDFTTMIEGSANMQGVLRLPSLFKRNNPEKLSVSVNSDLLGVKVNLPAPFAKEKNVALASSLAYRNKENSLHLDIGELTSIYFSAAPKQPLQLKQVSLGKNNKRVYSNKDGLMINGKIKQVAVDEWMAAGEKYLPKGKNDKENNDYPTIDIVIDELLWKPWPGKNLSIQAESLENTYQIMLDSPQGRGQVSVPYQQALPITAKFDHLLISKGNENSTLTLDPTKVRPFLFTSKNLSVNDLNFKNITLRAAKEEKGLSFNKIQVEAQDLKVNGSGAWRRVDEKQAQSFFNLELQSIDVEDSLEDVGFKSSLHGGELDSIINVRWSGAPYQFSLESAQGSATINARDGRIKDIDQGNAGRLLALLNLGAITRRLSLDFKDITKEGFSFDTITGAMYLTPGGILRADDVTIKSSSALVVISGHTDLKNQTYDQKVLVTPTLSGTLPVAGAIVGGPVGAAAGLLADQVAKAVGLNKVSVIEYKMTGTWNEPKIEKVGSFLVKHQENKENK
jgi:uncharacterized protein (TIGR02099 family)